MIRWVANAALCIVTMVAAMWLYANRGLAGRMLSYEAQASRPVTYTLARGPFVIEAPAFGELQAASATPISVPQVRTGGLAVLWIVRHGSLVEKGNTLVEFDASELLLQAGESEQNLEATLRQLEVTVLRASSDTGGVVVDRDIAGLELERAQTQAPRDEELFTRNEIIDGELDIGLSSTKVSELGGKIESKKGLNATSQRILVIDRKQHETRLDMLKQSLGSLKILAPHDGLVLHEKDNWMMEQGTTVGDRRWPGQAILKIPDITHVRARVYVLEADAGNLKVGQKGSVAVDSHPGHRFDVAVERIETLARPLDKDSPVKYFEVLLKIDAAGSEILRPGKGVRARITVARLENVLTAPRSALTEENRKYYMWVDGPRTPEKRRVEIGPGDGVRVAVVSGVREGESVLLNPPRPDVPATKEKEPAGTSRSERGAR